MPDAAIHTRTPVSGPVLFARYAFPPNSHGYCGPADHGAFFEHGAEGAQEHGAEGAQEHGAEGAQEHGAEGAQEHGAEGAQEHGAEGAQGRGAEGAQGRGAEGAQRRKAADDTDRGLRALSRQFAGAWPYLELIAASLGLDDPLDRRVVDAYWVGNSRLNRVTPTAVGNSMEDRFRAMTGSAFSTLAESVNAGGVPHHSFAVFCIYPWTGLLSDGRKAEHALTVLDQCRIRWGKVMAVHGDQVVVESTPLTWDGRTLGFGERIIETVERSVDGVSMMDDLEVGDWVSMHWEWACDKLTDRQVRYLRDFTVRHMRIVNEGNLHKGPAALLGT